MVGLACIPFASAVALLGLETLGSPDGTSSNPTVVFGILLLTILATVLWARARHLAWATTAALTLLALAATGLLTAALLVLALEVGCGNGQCAS